MWSVEVWPLKVQQAKFTMQLILELLLQAEDLEVEVVN
jgi:hypothetical protein